MPALCAPVWRWFEDLGGQRQYAYGYGIAAPQPISFTDMAHYFALTGERLRPWQRRLLVMVDELYRATINAKPDLKRAIGAGQLAASAKVAQ